MDGLAARFGTEMSSPQLVNLTVGVLEIALAVAAARGLRVFASRFPWLVALGAFFALRGAGRIYVAATDHDLGVLNWVNDGLIIITLLLLLAGLERTVRGLRTAVDQARLREREYDRALGDYRTLVRHRLGNPLSVIRGGIATLRAKPELDADVRAQILAAVAEQAERLETVSLDPEPHSSEETSLEPTPRDAAERPG